MNLFAIETRPSRSHGLPVLGILDDGRSVVRVSEDALQIDAIYSYVEECGEEDEGAMICDDLNSTFFVRFFEVAR